MRNASKMILVIAVLVFTAGIVMAPATASAATSGLINRKAGLNDLFILDKLFSKSQNGILNSSDKVNLGDLFVLDKLFPVQAAVVTPPTVSPVSLRTRLSGRIVVQVQDNGQAWYVNPADRERVSLGSPAQAFQTMSAMSIGITNADFNSLSVTVPASVKGKFILKVEDQGKLYYVNPVNSQVIYIGGPEDAFNLIQTVGLGISNSDISQIPITQ